MATGDHDDRVAASGELPAVSAFFLRTVRQVERGVRGVLQRTNRQLQFWLWGLGTVAIFLGILVLSITRDGLYGILPGIFVGLFSALLFAAAVGSLLLWAHRSPGKAVEPREAGASELERLLGPTLRELEAARAEVIRKVKERSVARVPAGMVLSVVLWVVLRSTDDPPGLLDLLWFVPLGALGGEIWAIGKLDREYRRLYKQRVLPQLAKRFGDLTYRQAAAAQVARLRSQRIFAKYDRAIAEDEIAGTYHGMPVSITEVRLEVRSGDDTKVLFDGLLIDLTLPRSLTGITVVMPDAGTFRNFVGEWRADGLERISLEDPRFEQRYEVYGTDQIEARALLTPAFMERFMALGGLPGLAPPGAIAEGNRLLTALPKRTPVDLFEPPSYWERSGGRVLLRLSGDIQSVLAMVDTVIDLDFWAAGRRRDSAGLPAGH